MNIRTVDQYRALIEHSTDLITLVDEEGVIQFESPSVEEILGYEPDELVGENAIEYFHPEDRERVVETFGSLEGTSGGTTGRGEYRFRHADGSWVWLETVATDRLDTSLEGYVLNSRDITERKERERELAEEHDKYSTLVEQTHDGIVILQDGTFVFANPRCLEILGYDESELVDKPFLDVIAPEDRDLVRERYEQRLDPDAESPPAQYETRFFTKEGEKRVVEVSASMIRYEGEPADLATVRDVTERRRYQERLEVLTTQLEVLNRIVRHDIRNDMNVIAGWGRLLEEHVDEAGRDRLQKLLTSAEHVVEITEISRDYIETLTGEEDPTVEPVSLCAVLDTELALRRDAFPEAEFVTPEEVPDVEVTADEMLSSVFRNLLNNAVQHNDSDTTRVEISCEVRKEDVVVSIADDGRGVPDDQKEAIFGKREKDLDSPGTGIGLYLVRTLVEQYGGEVWVEDNEPEGAVFAVRLPRAGSDPLRD